MKGILEKLEDEEFGYSPPFKDKFIDACPETAVIFSYNYSGIACGPVHMSVVIGIKYPEDDEE